MYQSLYITLRTGFRNPSKAELISTLNIIYKTQPNSTIEIDYMVFDNILPIQIDTVHGMVPNMKILNHLSMINYRDEKIDIQALLKQLK